MNTRQRMHSLRTDVCRLVNAVGKRADEFLLRQLKIKTCSIDYYFHDVQQLQLNYLTSIMAVEGHLHVMFAFSFEEALVNQITQNYTNNLDTSDKPKDVYIAETAADMLNVILGNSLKCFSISGSAIELTPPVVIADAKTIYRNKQAKFVTANLVTETGEMQIHCIGPKELFDSELNYIEEAT